MLVLAGSASAAARGTYTDNVNLHTQGYAGLAALHTLDPAAGGYTGRVVIHSARQSLAAERIVLAKVRTSLSALPHVLSAREDAPAANSSDHTTYFLVQFDVVPKTLGPAYLRRLETVVSPARQAGLGVYFGGDLDLLTQPPLADGRAELIGLGVAILVLLIGFGSVIGALVPLLSALVSVGIGLSLLGVVASVLTFATASPTLAVMIGLGVAIDYALFLTTRFRQLVGAGADPNDAAGVTVATSGHAVLVAAVTVSIAILGLYASGLTFLGQLGLAAVLSVVTAGAAAVTLVPAGLGLAGRRIDRMAVRTPVAESNSDSDGWHRYATIVGRRPWVFLTGGLAILAVLAIPTLSMHLGHVDDGADPTWYTDAQAYRLMAAAYGPGVNGTLTVVVDTGSNPAAVRAAIVGLRPPPASAVPVTELAARLRSTLASTPGVASVTPVLETPDHRGLVVTVTPRTGPQEPATAALFHRIERTVLPGVLRTSGAKGYVTGSTAIQIEFVDLVGRSLPIIIAVVLGAAFLALLITFRGLLLALKAAVLNVLSIGAAYGVIVAVFQWGWGRSLVGVSENVPIESYVPLLMFAIVFGLSLDYEVFLLSRVREVWEVTHDNGLSVAQGLASTARVISGAALIMASVFAAFVTSNSVVIKMIALGLSVSIVIDATVVRLVLVPAVMNLLGGESSWWMPRWLDRVLPTLGERPLLPARNENAMRITIASLGSRGDVQPLVVLGAELHRRGHEITMAVPPNLIGFVEAAGFAGMPLGPDSRDFLESPDGQRWLASGNARAFLKGMAESGHKMVAVADAQLLDACRDAALIICGLLGEDHALCVAEARGVPVISCSVVPIRATTAYPHYLVTTRALPPPLNWATWAIVDRLLWRELRGDTNALRSQLGLATVTEPTPARMARAGVLELQAYSGVVVPGLDAYGARRPLIGYLTPDSQLRARFGEAGVDADLEAWLAAGPPPIYFGFGSMPVLDPTACLAMLTQVSAELGLRALVSAGWSGITGGTDEHDHVRVVGALNHDLILGRCRAAVHHGGAGTTAAVLRVGIPSLVCSVFADQPFWGSRIERLGCGVHIRFPTLNAASLQSALRRVLHPSMAERARIVGEALRADDGAATRAVDTIEEWLAASSVPARSRRSRVHASAR